MLTYETIKKLCKDKGVTVTGVEKELGFARGSLCKVDTNKPSMEKVQKLADYFDTSVECLINDGVEVRLPEILRKDYMVRGTDKETGEEYYLNIETAKMAQDIFENKELRVLFDAARDASPDDLQTVHSMLLALKRKEQGNID